MLYVLVAIGTFLAIIIICFVLLMGTVRIFTSNDFKMETEELDPSTIETGDILCVGYNTIFGNFVRLWSHSVWTHVGLAYKDPTGAIFVLEACHYPDRNGILKVPLSVWIGWNKNAYLCVKRLRTIGDAKLNVEALLTEFKRYEEIKLDSFNWQWYRLLLTKKYQEPKMLSQHYTCYEVALNLLKAVGVVRKDYASSAYFPGDIVWGKFSTNPGFWYDHPVRLNAGIYASALKASHKPLEVENAEKV
jgi:hypothetical protein